MSKTIKQSFDEIVNFQSDNPEQKRSGCLYAQDAMSQTLRNYQIKDEVFKKCNFNTSKLISCKFIGCTFLECNFSAIECINCKFTECTIKNTDFTDAILTDTEFADCQTSDNNYNHLHCKNCKGLNAKDENVTADNLATEDTADELEQQGTKNAFSEKMNKLMLDNFPKWAADKEGDEYPSFVLGNLQNGVSLSLYADEEKNSTDSDNFWCLSVFFNNEPIFTSDFNFFGQQADDIVSIIENWKKEVIENNAPTILERIIEFLEQ